MKNPFKVGDKVKFKSKYAYGDKSIYKIYAIYSPTKVSLGLKDYPDVEQDYQTSIKKLKRVI